MNLGDSPAMQLRCCHHRLLRGWMIASCALWPLLARACLADPPEALPAPPPVLRLTEAVSFALQNNPELAAFRQQRGVASAAVVIANTYPFNPTWTNKLFADGGPISAGITNRVATEQRNPSLLERAAHSLKGSVGDMAAPQAFGAARSLEQMAREGT